MATPLHVQSQLTGTRVFKDEAQGHSPLHVQSQLAGTGVFQDEDQGDMQLQLQGQLAEQPCSQQQQQQQQQQQPLLVGNSGHHVYAVPDSRKRSHGVMSAGAAIRCLVTLLNSCKLYSTTLDVQDVHGVLSGCGYVTKKRASAASP